MMIDGRLMTKQIYNAKVDGCRSHGKSQLKIYSYEEAIDLTGKGRYNVGLLATLSLAIIGMGIDMFGISVIVTVSNCEFDLSQSKKSIILSMPFLGAILMAYPWGYISDTKGRKLSLTIALWGGFIFSALSAFSSNWIVLAAFRFLSTCFCSCANSSSYALLAESCPGKQRGSYMLIMSSILNLGFMSYMATAFVVLKLSFMVDLGLITFVPWRLLTIVLALPLGISALCLHFFFESPKFLINIGKDREALDYLHNIWRRNGRNGNSYPVNKVTLNEEGTVRCKGMSLIKSLWYQTAPLFKPPLLFRTLQLYYLTTAIFSITGGLFIWFPFLAKSFASGVESAIDGESTGLCNMISASKSTNATHTNMQCPAKIELTIFTAAVVEGVVFVSMNLVVAQLSTRKKAIMLAVLLTCAASAIATVVVTNNIAALIFFFGVLLNVVCSGLVFSYCVDLYPTSYRGMAACLGVMVARISSVIGINLLGAFITTKCEFSFYAISIYLFSAAAVACFLPPDRPKKES
ncbi:hypothetical protein K1T71_006406 [Dendrolimus kikuchii]|uniref:Uncharacterized protein n=1 Tax=Dendrolimus kikuchii TaxID=765133 RepID=A0ACC1D0S7_9NEOP|nr:hypothetical protein K1T71_006406 [Dendrolimus kikuchii]